MLIQLDVFTCVVLFFAYTLLDFLSGWYVISVQNLKVYLASFLSIMIGIISYAGVIKVVDNPWYGLPIVLGGGLGTFLILKWQKGRSNKGSKKAS